MKKARVQQAKRNKEGALRKFLNTKQEINEKIAALEQQQQQSETKLESNSLQVPGNSQVRSFLPTPEFDSFQLQHHHLLLCLEKITGAEINSRRPSRKISLHPCSTSQRFLQRSLEKSPSCCPCFPGNSIETNRQAVTSRNVSQRRCKSIKQDESSISKAKPRRSDLNCEGQTAEESNPLIILSIDPNEQMDFFPTNGNTMETSFHLSINSSTIDAVERSHSTCTSVLEVC